MKFYMPSRVYLEKNCVMNHREELAALGAKALIVTGRSSSRKNGSLSDVENALSASNIPYEIFDAIEENPCLETVERAAAFGTRAKADFVVGVGGGSPLDACKAVAVLMKNPGSGALSLYADSPLIALPVAAVPTTAGTGSEATPYAILTDHARKTKAGMTQRVFPALALTDPKYLSALPLPLRLNTAADALAHLAESFLNANATSYSRIPCEAGISLFAAFKDSLRKADLPEKTLSDMMEASTLAGMSIAHTGTSLPHGLSYHLTYAHGVPHGKAAAAFLAAFLKLYGQNAPEQADRFLRLAGFSDIGAFRDFLDILLSPRGSLSGEIRLSGQEVRSCAASILSNKTKRKNYPFDLTEEQLLRLLEDSVTVL